MKQLRAAVSQYRDEFKRAVEQSVKPSKDIIVKLFRRLIYKGRNKEVCQAWISHLFHSFSLSTSCNLISNG